MSFNIRPMILGSRLRDVPDGEFWLADVVAAAVGFPKLGRRVMPAIFGQYGCMCFDSRKFQPFSSNTISNAARMSTNATCQRSTNKVCNTNA